MSANLNEVMLHLDESLDEDALGRLEEGVRQDAGVISVGHNPDNAHMIMVVYDSEATRASTLLHTFQARGLHAQIVGL
ncbi:MAG: hypothetical protein AB1418_11745 [Pseudomonadota bacterium]